MPFLDTWITHHDDGTLSTTVFWKKTHTDKYLDFESHHPLAHKAAVADTLFNQAVRICKDFSDKMKEKEHVAQALRMNEYPRELITKNWETTAHPTNLRCQTHPKPKWSYCMSDTYVSETIRRILIPLRVCPCFCPHHTLRQILVHLKDRTPLRQQVGVVYHISFGGCKKVYIGQTGRTLDHRLKEHRRALVSENVQQSAVEEHVSNEMHDTSGQSPTF